jgi:hypothetical protein
MDMKCVQASFLKLDESPQNTGCQFTSLVDVAAIVSLSLDSLPILHYVHDLSQSWAARAVREFA